MALLVMAKLTWIGVLKFRLLDVFYNLGSHTIAADIFEMIADYDIIANYMRNTFSQLTSLFAFNVIVSPIKWRSFKVVFIKNQSFDLFLTVHSLCAYSCNLPEMKTAKIKQQSNVICYAKCLN